MYASLCVCVLRLFLYVFEMVYGEYCIVHVLHGVCVCVLALCMCKTVCPLVCMCVLRLCLYVFVMVYGEYCIVHVLHGVCVCAGLRMYVVMVYGECYTVYFALCYVWIIVDFLTTAVAINLCSNGNPPFLQEYVEGVAYIVPK